MSGTDDQNGQAARQTFPFEGLHVYQRTQEAWTAARHAAEEDPNDPLKAVVQEKIQRAAIGIARATARSRANGDFGIGLEKARGSLHAAAAACEQLERRGEVRDEELRQLLLDSSRMLGALIRSLAIDRNELAESEVAV